MMSTMRGIVLKEKGPAENLFLGKIPMPAIKSDDILLKVSYCGVNRPDLIQVINYINFFQHVFGARCFLMGIDEQWYG